MQMTSLQVLITVSLIALATMLTRYIPFIIFPEKKQIPKFVEYLGKVLPPAMIGLLVVFCFKNVDVTSYSFGLPELIAVTAVALLHLWKKNVLLSISVGTIVYMVLVQFVF